MPELPTPLPIYEAGVAPLQPRGTFSAVIVWRGRNEIGTTAARDNQQRECALKCETHAEIPRGSIGSPFAQSHEMASLPQ